MAITSYSTTPASNTSISGINIAEGCNPSGINDAIRQLMADIASGVNNIQMPSTSGTATAMVVALTPAVTTYAAGQRFQALSTTTSTGATTINYGGGVKNFKKRGAGGAVVDLAPNDIVTGAIIDAEYDGTQVILLNAPTYSHGADIASASTVNLDTATGDCVDVTGTTTITAITLSEGRQCTVRFTGALTLTNGASLVLPGGANITTAAGDIAAFRGYASGVVRCVYYSYASGVVTASGTQTLTNKTLTNCDANTQSAGNNSTKLATTAYVDTAVTVATQAEQEAGSSTTKLVTPGRQQFHPSAAKAWVKFSSSGGSISIAASYNVTSVTYNAAGDYTVNFTTAFSSASFAVSVTAGVGDSTDHLTGHDISSTASTCTIQTRRNTTNALDNAARISAFFYGDQ